MKYLFAVVCIFWGGFAAASDFPKLYAVIGVAADDVLNIRAEPNAQAELLGAFVYNASGVEVVALSDDGKWGQVNVNERVGWAAVRYLTPLSDTAPFFASCFGTEPFWGLILDETGVASEWSSPESKGKVTELETLMTTTVMPRTFAYAGKIQGENGRVRKFDALMTHKICSDGMSDNLYGLSIDLSLIGGRNLAGCCTLQR
ncbi:MAG: SH3 domain-containing protein [Ascidiaceihabitans sp.]|nr:SH3 domain-containing protein [Ascidiaceihabitans sp.]